MPRKKTIQDPELIEIIERYYHDECRGNSDKLKLPAIADFVANNGFPGYHVETLRRNTAARQYIESLKALSKNSAFRTVISYKTLDVEHFLATHPTKKTLISGLTALDLYSKSIADAAVQFQNDHAKLEKIISDLQEQYDNEKKKNEELTNSNTQLKKECLDLKRENKCLRKLANDYIYPEIANKLLVQDKFLKKPDTSYLSTETIDKNIIRNNTNIETKPALTQQDNKTKAKSPIVNDLFKEFEESD